MSVNLVLSCARCWRDLRDQRANQLACHACANDARVFLVPKARNFSLLAYRSGGLDQLTMCFFEVIVESSSPRIVAHNIRFRDHSLEQSAKARSKQTLLPCTACLTACESALCLPSFPSPAHGQLRRCRQCSLSSRRVFVGARTLRLGSTPMHASGLSWQRAS